ncbi:MAG: nitrilase-related carbon-nitrogen hydrolase [Gammaproteobacteria bacterium]|nr:MAG: nitrilase-related carbon-nitrogen hydrolase [Gammaproteobacteria bacterium]
MSNKTATVLVPRYAALALQLATGCVNDCPDRASARARMTENLARVRRSLAGSKGFIRQYNGVDIKLVVLPEYFLTGFPMAESIPEWRDKAALALDGPEYAELCSIARDMDLYLAGNAYEVDPHFPELYFQCCFIISPAGEVILRYRRLVSLSAPTPYDVWDRYLEVHGIEKVFPVADTPIGRLAAIASEEILYPEIARCHVMRGAELFVHPTSEVGSPQLTPKEIARRARAAENIAYVVSANSARLDHIAIPANSATGMSKIIDYKGDVLAEAAAGGESMVATATIDIEALRATRRRTGLTNMLVRQPFQLYAERYASTVFHPKNLLLRDGKARIPEKGELTKFQLADIERLGRDGLI